MSLRLLLRASALAVSAGFVLAPAAGAAPGGKPRASADAPAASIAIDQSPVALGDTVTFTVVGDAREDRVAVRCFQGSTMVYAEAAAVGTAFLLGGGWSTWKAQGGAASCTAELFRFTYRGNTQTGSVTLATTSFDAAG